MGVYLGDAGWVELRRTSVDSVLTAVVNAADVNTKANRMGFDRQWGSLITGDRISVRSVDKTPLLFIDGWSYESIECYIHVDDLEGVRLYDRYPDAINGFQGPSLLLKVPTTDQPVTITVNNLRPSLFGKMTSYELTTSRETVDITALGEEFRMQYTAGLISGQGQLRCFWDYRDWPCSTPDYGDNWEWANYMHQLIIRTELGSAFYGRFIVKGEGARPGVENYEPAVEQQLFYRAMCTVTNASISFISGEPVVSVIDFVTTGPIQMRLTPINLETFLELEENDYLTLQENRDRIVL